MLTVRTCACDTWTGRKKRKIIYNSSWAKMATEIKVYLSKKKSMFSFCFYIFIWWSDLLVNFAMIKLFFSHVFFLFPILNPFSSILCHMWKRKYKSEPAHRAYVYALDSCTAYAWILGFVENHPAISPSQCYLCSTQCQLKCKEGHSSHKEGGPCSARATE